MHLFYQPLISEGIDHLDGDEARHATRVMRLQKGDELQITDGKGYFYRCVVSSATKSDCYFSIIEKIETPQRGYSIHIAIAPTKSPDRMEWFVEKVAELGIDKITFISCANSERTSVNVERLVKKAVSGMKQSKQSRLPQIEDITRFDGVLDTEGEKFIAYVDTQNPELLKHASPKGDYTVLIGPEGDFSTKELSLATKKGFKKVSLGSTTLRTETAGIIACHTLHLINS
ncbi:MAG: 16S rRNA (uracil(1498)-N(3))-methyltransferase [Cyclobacteriaceae bacterium]|nr:16S rRNA (uracil(1498)-N(3))-methyltransferase [Cyclobacteriaceae bacterium]